MYAKRFIAFIAFGMLAVAFAMFIFQIRPEHSTVDNTDNGPSAAVPPPSSIQPTKAEDHELHLLPNLFGRGAVSDGRTYSVALVSAYQSKIPPATELFAQGIVVGQSGPYTISIRDEQDAEKTLICGMDPKEFQDAAFLYHTGDRVQVFGEYVNAFDGVPTFQNCRIAGPTDKVVRPETAQAPTSPEAAVAPSPVDVDSIRTAAERGDAGAQSKLGMMFHNGQGVPRDDIQAADWWRKSAEQGNAAAENDLGASYHDGRGVRQDRAQEIYWVRKAAEQGYSLAQDNLGVAYAHGQGVPKDDAQAADWYRKAAEQGYAKAQGHLGVLYLQGQGLSQDYAEAYFWMALAASGKVEGIAQKDVEELRDAAASHLTPERLSQAQERVQKWTEDHSLPQ